MGHYVTAEEAAEYLSVDLDDPAVRASVTAQILVAESVVDGYLNTSYKDSGPTNVTLLVDGNGESVLSVLPPFRELVSVSVLPTYPGLGVSMDVPCIAGPTNPVSTVYRFVQARNTAFTFPVGLENVQVVCKCGFATVPEVFKLGVLICLKFIYDSKDMNALVGEERNMDRAVRYAAGSTFSQYGIPPVAAGLLKNFRVAKHRELA